MRTTGKLEPPSLMAQRALTMNTDLAANTATPDSNGKSVGAAYLLWLVLGFAGGHRFYVGRFGSGVAMAVLAFNGGMWVLVRVGQVMLAALALWVLIDAFLIPGWVRRVNSKHATRECAR